MIWNKKEIDPQETRDLANRYNIGLLEASIFLRRGIIKPEDTCFFLEQDLRFLHHPFLFEEMPDAVERINDAIAQEQNIMVFGDRDADGITSTVIMVKAIQRTGGNVQWSLPMGDDDYGLTNELIDSFIAKGIQLLVTVDCGISNIREINYANMQGLDVIVIDHHNPHDEIPEALAIINPKLEECGYPFKDMAGCAVALKVSWALAFSQLELYGEPLWLFHIQPSNDTYQLTLIQLLNCVEQKRIQHNLVPGLIEFEKTPFADIAFGNDLYTYNAAQQNKLLAKIFTSPPELEMVDVAPFLWEVFPTLTNKSLLKIREVSRIARYAVKPLDEIDVLMNLYISFVMKKEESLTERITEDLDLVSMGTLADIMPLVNENRVFVKLGLQLLSTTKRRGLRELIIKRDLHSRAISSLDVSWYLTPVINASGRMGEPEKAAQMLLTEDPDQASQLADYIIELNKRRKNLGDSTWKKHLNKAADNFLKSNNKFVFISGDIHRGITGIMASRLLKYFNAPALVVACLKNKAVGSLRSNENVNAKGFLSQFSEILSDFGGHDLAGGFSMPLENLALFETRFFETVQNLEAADTAEVPLSIDAEIPPDYLTPDLWKVVELFQPFGEQNPPLNFLSRNLTIRQLDLMGKKESSHVKLLFESANYKWPGVFWNAGERAVDDFNLNDKVDVVYQLTKNYYQNNESLRFTVIDIKRSKQ
ncbi:MAG: single-stranded-DNA-specific exonuclease RecJ [Spirochaetales bacterium]|nr:single-stranded-DNA-specific exonuclease RecJ [Spirochaetales bacterium]